MKVTLMEKARARMLVKHSFFAAAVMSTPLVVDNSMPTAATDMHKIYYNDKFIKSLNTNVTMFVFAHEVMHILLKHGLRFGRRKRTRANIAMDLVINVMLLDAGFEIWAFAWCDPQYRGMSWEQVYQLREERHKRMKAGLEPYPPKSYPREGLGVLDDFSDVEDDAGGGGDGPTRPGGDPGDDRGGMGNDVMDLPEGMDKEAREKLDRKISDKLAQAAMAGRMRGRLPGGLDLMIEGAVRPPLPWYDILREWMLALASYGESWNHRNRRFQDVYLPARQSRTAMGELVVIGDTSGSMSGIYGQLNVEFPAIMEALQPERLRIIWADDEDCSRMEVFERGETVEIKPKGGGGTDMRKPLKFVEQFDPIVVVLVTDGYTPWPEQEPPYPLITISTTNVKCPHGQTVHFVET